MNNNEQFDKFIREFDTIRMTSDEKNKIAQNLEAFANSYVLTPSPYVTYASFFRKSLAMALIAVLFVSASKPASARSLPGELLYPVKIIHEKITTATITKPEKKVVYEIKRTETRIQEAVHLANTQKLDSDTQKKIAVDIQKQVAEVAEKIKVVKQDNPETALSLNSDLKTTLKVNSEALKTVTRTTKKKKKLPKQEKEVVKEVETKKDNVENIGVTTPIENTVVAESPVSDTDTTNTETNTVINTESAASEDLPVITSIATEVEITAKTETSENVDDTDTTPAKNLSIYEDTAKLATDEDDYEYDSFADIILDTIEGEIEDTENTKDSIEEEIVEKLDEKEIDQKDETDVAEEKVTDEVVESSNEVKVSDETSKTEDIENTVVPEPIDPTKIIHTETDEKPTSESGPTDEELRALGFSEEQIISLQAILENKPVPETGTKPEKAVITDDSVTAIEINNDVQTSFESITTDVQLQITSLESILAAEATLNTLFLELDITRDEDMVEDVHDLIEDEKHGQAFIAIHQEIERLNEIKLSRQVSTDLGIYVDTQKTKTINDETISVQ